MNLRSFFAIAIAALLSLAASATPQHKLATGLWFEPRESGWGLNLFHQGSTVFAALFVYGPDGQPRWYTASNIANPDDGGIHDHTDTVMSGDLYESTGPWFGGPFDPSRVTRRKVGTLTLDLFGADFVGIEYTIDGVRVFKSAQPFFWRRDDISGDYVGFQWQPPASEDNRGPEILKEVTVHIVDNGSTLTMSTADSTGTCNYNGTRGQSRDFVTATGSYSCSNGSSGNWFTRMDVTPDGIVGSSTGNGITSFWGRMAASRTDLGSFQGNGWRNDLWFPPNESGWGVNILEQGDTIFATLFVYDQQGRSHWYSASEMRQTGPNADDGGFVYLGPLYESAGPYYGTAFNPSAVTRRQVGTMDFQAKGNGTATLHYTVDGVSVTKNISRFAFAKNSLTGNYSGHIVSYAPTAAPETVSITIDDSRDPLVMDTSSSRGTCHYIAPMQQLGELRRLSGSFQCSDGRSGSFLMDNVILQWNGFSGSFQGNGINVGHIEGVLRAQN